MIHPEAKFKCGPAETRQVTCSKIQWWDRHRLDIPIPKGRPWKEEKGIMGPKQVQNLAGQIPLDF